MHQTILGWTVLAFGCLLMLRVLFRRNDSLSKTFGTLSIGVFATLTGLWLVRMVDLPGAVADVFARL